MHAHMDPHTRQWTLTGDWDEWRQIPATQDLQPYALAMPLWLIAPIYALLNTLNEAEGVEAVLRDIEPVPGREIP